MTTHKASAARMTPDAFVTAYYSYASNAFHRINVSPWVILAQWAVETGWGSSHLASLHNLAGIRWYGRPGQVAQVGGDQHANGSPVVGTGFASYRSIGAFVDDYVHVLGLPYYAKVRALWQPSDTESGVIIPQCVALGRSPYDAGHYGGDAHPGSSLVAAWRRLAPIAAARHARGPNA